MSATGAARRASSAVFGRVITGNDVERSALATLRQHLPRYVREVERQEGRDVGGLPNPYGYIVASDFDRWPEDQLPVVVVISPGLAGRPERDGRGQVVARWSVAAGVVTSAAEQTAARSNALTYIAAVRLVLMQFQALDGLALTTDFQDERYDPGPFDMSRSLFSAQATFEVAVSDVASYGLGPYRLANDPDPTDPAEWPIATQVAVDIVPTALDQPLTLADSEDDEHE